MQIADAQTLIRICSRERFSLLYYLDEAFPWTGNGDQKKSLDGLRKLTAEQRDCFGSLISYLARQKLSPGPGAYPLPFQSLNYLGLDHLLPRVVAEQNNLIQELERDIQSITHAESRSLVQELLEVKKRQRQELEWLAKENSNVVSTIR